MKRTLIGKGNYGTVHSGVALLQVTHANNNGAPMEVQVAIKQPKEGWAGDFADEVAVMDRLQQFGVSYSQRAAYHELNALYSLRNVRSMSNTHHAQCTPRPMYTTHVYTALNVQPA